MVKNFSIGYKQSLNYVLYSVSNQAETDEENRYVVLVRASFLDFPSITPQLWAHVAKKLDGQ